MTDKIKNFPHHPITSATIKSEYFLPIDNGITTRCSKTLDIGVSHITTTFIAHLWLDGTKDSSAPNLVGVVAGAELGKIPTMVMVGIFFLWLG